MQERLLKKVIANNGESLGLLEVTDSTLVGLRVKDLKGKNEGENSYVIVLADKIVSGLNRNGLKVNFCPDGEKAEQYTLETRTDIMKILPAGRVMKDFKIVYWPKWSLIAPEKSSCLVEEAYSGFHEISESFANESEEYNPYQTFLRERDLSWNKRNFLGSMSGLELRFDEKPE